MILTETCVVNVKETAMNVCPVMARGDMRKRSHLFDAVLSTRRIVEHKKVSVLEGSVAG